VWLIAAFLLEASARAALGEQEAAGRALERGLDLAGPDGLLFPFLLHPVPELLERHARQRTAHPALIRKIISALGGRTPAVPAAPAAPAAGPPEHLPEPLSQAEARVLHFLPTSLSAPEIARELYVSVNTVRTHMRHLYDKLGAHRRLEAIDRARALGLLAPVPQRALTLHLYQAHPNLAPGPGGLAHSPGDWCRRSTTPGGSTPRGDTGQG
jgi:LuxR family maltose regulon positive regulatory protein